VASRRPFLALLLASCSYVIVLDTFAAAVAFPRIEEAFPSTPRTTLAWVSSGYSIALAALLLVSGKLGDRYGRRKVYLRGMAVFTAGALLSAAAPTPALLIAARVVQGGGGAMMVSTSVALALLEYPPERRGVAMGWNGMIGSLASLLGPVLAGNVIEIGGSWRWVFLASLPLGVPVLVFGPRFLQETQPAAARTAPIDGVGVVVGITATGLATFGVIQSGQWGWSDPRTLTTLAAALALGALFVWRCRTTAHPLLRLEIFGQRRFLVATVSQLGTQLGVFAFFFSTPLFLVNVWGWSTSGVGWALAVPLVVSFTSVATGRFADRSGYRGVLALGGLVGAAAMVWWVLVLGDQPRFWTQLLPGLLLYGISLGMVGITSAAAALVGLEADELAMANSAFQTSRRLAQTLGTAAAVAILGNRSADSLSSFRWVWMVNGAGYLFSAVVALWYPARRRAARSVEHRGG
jgi:EmrB/QacA subfamily drug resistance transporter